MAGPVEGAGYKIRSAALRALRAVQSSDAQLFYMAVMSTGDTHTHGLCAIPWA